MRIAIFLFTFLLNVFSVHAQQFKWVKGGGTNFDFSSDPEYDWESTKYICTDPNGNIYALSQVGNNSITADTFYRSSAYGAYQNTLLTSYNCNGQMRWAKLIGSSSGNCVPAGIIADSLGHVYVSGSFQPLGGTLHIGYDATFSGTAYEYQTQALIQFDTSGHYNWLSFIGNNAMSTLAGVGAGAILSIDGANYVHLFSYMKAGVHITSAITSIGGTYDLVYNSSGTLLSQVRLDLDSEWYLNGAVIDPVTNKVYVSGQINQSIYGGFLTDTFYAAAFDVSRSLLWQYFTGNDTQASGIVSVALDQSKHLHFTGGSATYITTVPTTFSFNGMSVSNTHYPLYAISIILTTDTNGHPEWIKKFDCDLSINSFASIIPLPNNKVAALGTFVGHITDGTASLTTPPGEGDSPYIVVLDSSGDLQTIQQIHGDGTDNGGMIISSDKVGNIYVGGEVIDSIWAGTPPIPAYHTVGGNTDFFVMKYGVDCSCTSMPVASYTNTGAHIISATYTGTTAGIDSLVWSFGDGATAYGTTALHTYTAIGTYQLCATVYTDCGQDSICNDVVVTCIATPLASFTDTGTHIVGFVYTGSTTGIDSIVWNFGDGHADTGMKPLHTYTVSGSYHACVTAYTACGKDSSCNTITVAVPRTGITSVNLSDEVIQVYPNPANDALNISGITESTNYRLLSVTGACVMQGVFEVGNNILPMQKCVPGVYILEMTAVDGKRNIVRVVKQ